MSDTEPLAKTIRFAEGDVLNVRFQPTEHPLRPLKPDQLNRARIVGKLSDQPLLMLLANHCYPSNTPHQLDVGHLFGDIGDLVKL